MLTCLGQPTFTTRRMPSYPPGTICLIDGMLRTEQVKPWVPGAYGARSAASAHLLNSMAFLQALTAAFWCTAIHVSAAAALRLLVPLGLALTVSCTLCLVAP